MNMNKYMDMDTRMKTDTHVLDQIRSLMSNTYTHTYTHTHIYTHTHTHTHTHIHTNTYIHTTIQEIESDLTLDAVFGIKDPLRPDVKDAVRALLLPFLSSPDILPLHIIPL